MAENTIFLLIANVLANFDIMPLEKERGGLGSLDEATHSLFLVQ